jgi:hypothetical protein
MLSQLPRLQAECELPKKAQQGLVFGSLSAMRDHRSKNQVNTGAKHWQPVRRVAVLPTTWIQQSARRRSNIYGDEV